jgi:hypothetical protein
MIEKSSNDNEVQPSRAPDAHGQAAMLISVTDAIDIVDLAREVKSDIGEELGEIPATLQKSINLLQAVSTSLRTEIPRS